MHVCVHAFMCYVHQSSCMYACMYAHVCILTNKINTNTRRRIRNMHTYVLPAMSCLSHVTCEFCCDDLLMYMFQIRFQCLLMGLLVYTCMYAYMYLHTHIEMHIFICIYVHMYIYTHTYICKYIHICITCE